MSEEKNDKKFSVWSTYSDEDKKNLENLNAGYINFLSKCKTERESVNETIRLAREHGYKSLDEFQSIKAGDKIFSVCMNKSIVLFNIGTEPIERGMKILGAHIDTCRLDLKQNPLYEDGGFALFDTHYYGGIKKYQWVTLPLAMHGVVIKKDGSTININIGENENDPVFCVTDLLIHLSQEQMEKKATKVIEGENLDILIGNYPLKDGDKESVKEGIKKILKDNYNIDEEDFLSAEIALVPAGRARELGLDRSMIFSAMVKMIEFVLILHSLLCLNQIKLRKEQIAVFLSIKKKLEVTAQQVCSHNFLKICSPKFWIARDNIPNLHCVALFKILLCFLLMFQVLLILSTLLLMTKKMSPISVKEWFSINLQVQEENREVQRQMQNMLPN